MATAQYQRQTYDSGVYVENGFLVLADSVTMTTSYFLLTGGVMANINTVCACLYVASVCGICFEGSATETVHPKEPGSVQVLVYHQLDRI